LFHESAMPRYIPPGYLPLGVALTALRHQLYSQEQEEEEERHGPPLIEKFESDGQTFEVYDNPLSWKVQLEFFSHLHQSYLKAYVLGDDGSQHEVHPDFWASRDAASEDLVSSMLPDDVRSRLIRTTGSELVIGIPLLKGSEFRAYVERREAGWTSEVQDTSDTPPGSAKASPAAKRTQTGKRRAYKQDRVRAALRDAFPGKAPLYEGVTSSELVKAVGEILGKGTPDRTTILRAAGRRK
jgi:hypothetical protein